MGRGGLPHDTLSRALHSQPIWTSPPRPSPAPLPGLRLPFSAGPQRCVSGAGRTSRDLPTLREAWEAGCGASSAISAPSTALGTPTARFRICRANTVVASFRCCSLCTMTCRSTAIVRSSSPSRHPPWQAVSRHQCRLQATTGNGIIHHTTNTQ